jgi:hypothetical protein
MAAGSPRPGACRIGQRLGLLIAFLGLLLVPVAPAGSQPANPVQPPAVAGPVVAGPVTPLPAVIYPSGIYPPDDLDTTPPDPGIPAAATDDGPDTEIVVDGSFRDRDRRFHNHSILAGHRREARPFDGVARAGEGIRRAEPFRGEQRGSPAPRPAVILPNARPAFIVVQSPTPRDRHLTR